MDEKAVQKQLAPLGAPPDTGKALMDFSAASGLSLDDLFRHLPEVLALLLKIIGKKS